MRQLQPLHSYLWPILRFTTTARMPFPNPPAVDSVFWVPRHLLRAQRSHAPSCGPKWRCLRNLPLAAGDLKPRHWVALQIPVLAEACIQCSARQRPSSCTRIRCSPLPIHTITACPFDHGRHLNRDVIVVAAVSIVAVSACPPGRARPMTTHARGYTAADTCPVTGRLRRLR